MKLNQLINSKTSLETLMRCPLPLNVSWELKLFVKAINPELTAYEEIRSEKVKEMGETITVDGKQMLRVKQENLVVFTEHINALLDRELDIRVPVIKAGVLMEHKDVNGKGMDISVNDLMALDWLIVE